LEADSVFAQEVIDRLTVYLCDSLQFNYIQPTFPKFALRNERVGFAKALGNLSLKVAGVVPRFYQALQKSLVSPLVCRIAFVHKLSLRDR
jgi:hypothetical protein